METNKIIAGIDEEISRLTEVKRLLAGEGTGARRGKKTASTGGSAKRTLSPEARKRIADAQRKRWAAQKRSAK